VSRSAHPARPARAKTPRPAAAGAVGERLLKIGEAAALLGVEAYVLRFWETQFPFLRPRHARSRHRFYSDKDIETLRLIKRLLHEERFTIEGARKYIREVGLESAMVTRPAAAAQSAPAPTPAASARADGNAAMLRTIAEVRRELESLHKLLEQ